MRRLSFALLLAAAAPVVAAEGMWLPSQTGRLGETLRKEGLQLLPAALGDLDAAPLNAIASLGGCSASFVSPQGLVATNHHCVYGSIQYNATPERDLIANGFLAKTLGEELPAAPGTRVYVIEDLRDVTKAALAGVAPSVNGRARYDRIEANRKRLIADCEKQPSRRCDVRPYFGGNTYYLQQQLEIRDVRLAYAPASGIGNFGGEIDNWRWPRHTGDFGFYRAYVAPDGSSADFAKANVPFKPKSWLTIAKEGLKDGDYVMVAGFPGVTERHRTAAEADFYYAQFYPRQQKLLADQSELIMRATANDEAARIKYASIVKGADNYKKKLAGQIEGATAIDLKAKKAADEKAFRDWVAADAARSRRHAGAIAALDTVAAEAGRAQLDAATTALLNQAQLLSAARTAYRWAQERAKPDADREPGYQDRDRRMIVERLTQIERRYVASVDRALFERALREYATLPAASRNAAFEARLREIGLDRLYADTKLADTATRVGWLEQPLSAFATATDPFIRLAVAGYPGEIAAEGEDKARAGRMQAARSGYMAARLAYAAEEGRTLYPDANGSLRFTYGKVSGRTRDGESWTPFTTVEGMVAKHTGVDPFDAPAAAIERAKAKDFGGYASKELGTLPIDYLSTVDITNGNSGSATLNARGEFVGLAFDGTLDGIIADWWFDPAINRTIHVDSRYMLWAMDKVDGATRLLEEIGVQVGPSS